MNNKFLSLLALIVISFCGIEASAQHSNCGVNPEPNSITQPDGSVLTIHALGNEAIHYLETSNGYTVLLNKATGNFEYATVNAQGNLDLSGVVASDKADRNMGKTNPVSPHLRYNETQRQMLLQYFDEQNRVKTEMGKAGANVFSPNGDRKVVVLLVEYPDLRATIPASNFTMLMNQPNNAGTGSFRDYYLSATKNRLRLTGDVYGWFMADSGYKYYGKTSSPSYGTATRKLLVGAINAADTVVDFTQYDSDSDGYVDAVILIHAGIGAEESSAPNSGNYIWSFRSTISSGQTPTKDGKKFSAYCIFPEKLYNSGSPIIVGIGVIAHEFGHILDLPDLYATSYNNEGAGDYTIMAAGSWLNYQKTPCIFDAWSRSVLGWTNPVVITDIGNYTIRYCVSDSNFAYRINTKKPSEYFLLENRQYKGFDKFLPSKGMAVWHINTAFAGKLSQLPNNTNNDTSQLGVQLLQADGLRELERNVNLGNQGDLFPGSLNKRNLTPFTNPSTNLQSTYQSTNIYITNITQNPDSSISFRFSSQPSAAFSPDKFSGCAPLTLSLTNSSMSASAFKWSFGDGRTDVQNASPVITFENAGSYTIMLTVYDSLGVQSDSMVTTVQVYPSPKASYSNVQSGNKLTLTNTSNGANAVQWQYNIGSTSFSSSSNLLKDLVIPDSVKFTYKLIAFNNYGCADTAYGETYAFPTGLNDLSNALSGAKAYPNPFSGELRVAIQLKQTTELTLEMVDIIGETVASLAPAKYAAGNQTILFNDQANLKPGMYFLRVISGNESKTMRLMKTE